MAYWTDNPRHQTTMKSLTMKFTAAAAAVLTMIGTPETRATDVTMDGSGFYQLGTGVHFYRGGAFQSGRYNNLGRDYYHRATIGMRWITNHSPYPSGDLSFEFWGMPYYGANHGIVLMTRSLVPLGSLSYFLSKTKDGYAVFLGSYRFPELDLWEYTRNGWRFRDAVTFRHKDLL